MRAKYILSEVMVGLWRNVTMTVAMIITMAVSDEDAATRFPGYTTVKPYIRTTAQPS